MKELRLTMHVCTILYDFFCVLLIVFERNAQGKKNTNMESIIKIRLMLENFLMYNSRALEIGRYIMYNAICKKVF